MDTSMETLKRSIDYLNLVEGKAANKSWFKFQYLFENPDTPLIALGGAAFNGMDIAHKVASAEYYFMDDYGIYEDNVNNALSVSKPKRTKQDRIDRLEKNYASLETRYSSLAGKLGGYTSAISRLRKRIEKLESVLLNVEGLTLREYEFKQKP